MDNELIERLAKEAGLRKDGAGYTSEWSIHSVEPDDLAKFAALVAEECAKEAEAAFQPMRDFKGTNLYFERCARVIRTKFPAPANTPNP